LGISQGLLGFWILDFGFWIALLARLSPGEIAFAFDNPKSQIQNLKSAYSTPHIPRCAAPQEPQGPGS
jgi:hypothetical protein